MNIYANQGHRVIVVTLEAGYDHHKRTAKKYLEVGKEYTVASTRVYPYHTDVILQEIKDVTFNSVFFEDVEGQNNNDQDHPDYSIYNG